MLLIEEMLSEVSFDMLYQQYVESGKLTDEVFNQIQQASNDKSAYGTWLAKKVATHVVKAEDLDRFSEYFKIFDRFKKKFPFPDINQYKTEDAVDTFIERALEIEQGESERTGGASPEQSKNLISSKGISDLRSVGIKFLGVIDGYQIFKVPMTAKGDEKAFNIYRKYLAQCKGRDTGDSIRICTMANQSYFDRYLNSGPYYVIYNLNDSKSPYQFHYESNQFMDKNDRVIVGRKSPIMTKVLKFIEDQEGKSLKIGGKIAHMLKNNPEGVPDSLWRQYEKKWGRADYLEFKKQEAPELMTPEERKEYSDTIGREQELKNQLRNKQKFSSQDWEDWKKLVPRRTQLQHQMNYAPSTLTSEDYEDLKEYTYMDKVLKMKLKRMPDQMTEKDWTDFRNEYTLPQQVQLKAQFAPNKLTSKDFKEVPYVKVTNISKNVPEKFKKHLIVGMPVRKAREAIERAPMTVSLSFQRIHRGGPGIEGSFRQILPYISNISSNKLLGLMKKKGIEWKKGIVFDNQGSTNYAVIGTDKNGDEYLFDNYGRGMGMKATLRSTAFHGPEKV